MEAIKMLRRAWISGVVCAVILGGSWAVPPVANAQGLWLGGVGGWGGVGGVVPARVAYPVVVSRPVVVAPRPVVVAPTPHAYRHVNRVVRRAWRRGW
jgi:hypothetical protein